MNEQPGLSDYHQRCREALAAEQAHSLAQTDQWAHVDKARVHADWDALYRQLAPLVDTAPHDGRQVQALMHEHFGIVSRFYTPSKLAYVGMSLFYAENADMKKFHDAYHPGMVDFLTKAMPVYAGTHL